MKRILLNITIVLLTLVHANCLYAQTTHAHSTSRHWKGIDVEAFLQNSSSTPQEIYLYNVGTGRFVIEGGMWGMEARLFFEDFGRQMMLYRDSETKGHIESGIAEQTNNNKRSLICNVPTVTRGEGWTRASDYSFTTILDGNKDYEKWSFVRVETDPNSEYHTYYMYQQHENSNKNYLKKKVKDLKFYLGAGYGKWCSDGTTEYGGTNGGTNDKGCGFYVHLDDDRSCWTTAGQATSPNEILPYENDTEVLVNGDMVPIKELYQWRIISKEEFLRILTEEVIGLNPSVSSLVPDRDFTRNSKDFDSFWVVSPTSTTPAQGEGRYGFTWGESERNNNQKGKFFNEAWDAPVRLKKAFQDIRNAKNAKFGFMSFEGIGTVSVTFKLPQPGWYQIEGCGINFGPSNHKAYMYAQAGGVTLTQEQMQSNIRARYGYGEVELVHKTANSEVDIYDNINFAGNYERDNEAFNINMGKVLTYHSDDYRRKFLIYIDPQNYNQEGEEGEIYKKLTLGFRKDYATKSTTYKSRNNKKHYYDTDWLCADDIKISYMGLAPVFLYEEEEDLDYLVYDETKIEERPSAQPDGRYSGAVSLERTLQKDMWNSFSCPIPLTGEQVRSAFGEDAVLAELNSIGNMSWNSNVIDFKTVELKPVNPLDTVVHPGKFYLLWPKADPITGEDPLGREKTFYSLGRNFFSVNPEDSEASSSYEHQVVDLNDYTEDYTVSSYNDANDGHAYVTYVRTPGFSEFAVTNGIYTGSTANGIFAPKGSYVLSRGKFYEINKDTPIKGFRGWITLDHSIFDDSSSSVKIAFDGVIDNGEGISDIDMTEFVPLPVSADTAVYNLSGVKVGVVGDHLKKGIYIVRGKKFVVK